jgi:hypothetical protein
MTDTYRARRQYVRRADGRRLPETEVNRVFFSCFCCKNLKMSVVCVFLFCFVGGSIGDDGVWYTRQR